jgi:hypothetical protein
MAVYVLGAAPGVISSLYDDPGAELAGILNEPPYGRAARGEASPLEPDPGSIDVSVDGNTLTVSVERSAPVDAQDWLVAEQPRGRVGRRLSLGPQLDIENLHATYDDGVLTLTIPVAAQAGPRQIAVAHGGHAASITIGSESS